MNITKLDMATASWQFDSQAVGNLDTKNPAETGLVAVKALTAQGGLTILETPHQPMESSYHANS